jgi:hypothetical protein
MKKIYSIVFLFLAFVCNAQNGISYQAVIMNPSGEELPGADNLRSPLVNKTICLRFSIKSSTIVEYQENIPTTTDEFGMVNVVIGTGIQTGGTATNFAAISWDGTPKNLLVEFDSTASCSTFINVSDQPFTTVPFAYYSANSGTSISPSLSGPITSVGNVTSVASQTGAGSTFVMNASPILVTPNIGAATGISLNVSGQLTSTITTGTAPFVVASTTPVANLSIGGNAATATTVTTNANLTGPITSVGNISSVASQTGTGSTFVMNASPTLVTPNIGDASGISLTLSGNTTVGGTLGVTGATLLSTLGTIGAATVGGTLGVTGATTLGGAADINNTLDVTGATSLTTLGATGVVDFDTTLNVDGTTTTNGINNSGNISTGTLGVTGLTTTAGITDSVLISAKDVTASGTLGVTGLTTTAGITDSVLISAKDVTASGTLGVMGLTTTAGITDSVLISANDVTASGTLGVTGLTTTAGISNSGAISTGTLATSGLATLNSASVNTILDVTGATTLSSTLDVTGVTNLNNSTTSTTPTTGSLIVDGGVGIAKNLNVGQDATVGGKLNVKSIVDSSLSRINPSGANPTTINAMSGRFSISSGTSITVINSNVTLNSIILCTIAKNSSEKVTILQVIAAGSLFFIEISDTPTTSVDINFLVIN